MNFHEVDFATTRADAFDLGFAGSFGFLQFIIVLVGILQNLRGFFSERHRFLVFSFWTSLSRWSKRNVRIPSSKATRCSAGCLAKVPSRGVEKLCIGTNELIDRRKP